MHIMVKFCKSFAILSPLFISLASLFPQIIKLPYLSVSRNLLYFIFIVFLVENNRKISYPNISFHTTGGLVEFTTGSMEGNCTSTAWAANWLPRWLCYLRRKKMKMLSLENELKENSYPGRGIVIGKSPNGKFAVTAYFIMGRSENSRNRVFVTEGEGIRTEAFDPSKLVDPSLIIYAPVRVLDNKTIVTNGDQTDTVYDLMAKGKTFEESLRTREFEPDGPNYTPRISGIIEIADGSYNYAMSILKSNNGDPSCCNRYTFTYDNPVNGEGHFIHTYMHDGNPLPSFEGEPKLVPIMDDMEQFTEMLWNNLNEDNKVSLFVRYINIEDGTYETKIINKNN